MRVGELAKLLSFELCNHEILACFCALTKHWDLFNIQWIIKLKYSKYNGRTAVIIYKHYIPDDKIIQTYMREMKLKLICFISGFHTSFKRINFTVATN